MPYYYYGYNSTGLLPVLICALFAMWASWNVNSTFKKYAKQNSTRRITGAQAAQRVLSANGVTYVRAQDKDADNAELYCFYIDGDTCWEVRASVYEPNKYEAVSITAITTCNIG